MRKDNSAYNKTSRDKAREAVRNWQNNNREKIRKDAIARYYKIKADPVKWKRYMDLKRKRASTKIVKIKSRESYLKNKEKNREKRNLKNREYRKELYSDKIRLIKHREYANNYACKRKYGTYSDSFRLLMELQKEIKNETRST